ncbi:hypothetical protein [Methylobacterium nodulans]|uniref:Uncharacterized protein n=1 Tax=Methylobacterium nodulans (strain LMG 21967 / CNCM I-2342 / ORS 2060) TaxID=460265 RepID=B8IUJ1_METNO|nr:hypothetical protein [Methylobacterium nodulans]ACL57059.1 hypothetical protein Mnod_2074 [Methylobacterium nodulans ORS 2060]
MQDNSVARLLERIAELETDAAERDIASSIAFAVLAQQLDRSGAISGLQLVDDLREVESHLRGQDRHAAGIRYIHGLVDLLPEFLAVKSIDQDNDPAGNPSPSEEGDKLAQI